MAVKKLWARIEAALTGSPQHRANLTSLALPKRRALPLFGADSISSVAYAPDEIVMMLVLAGTAGLVFAPWVALGIAVMLMIVVGTYRYNIFQIAEQGDYALVHNRLGAIPAMTLGAASMVDFLLTVAVSASSGASFVIAIWPRFMEHDRLVAMALVVAMTLFCLRGLRTMGRFAVVPTYAFLVLLAITIVTGVIADQFGWLARAESSHFYVIPRTGQQDLVTGFGLFLLLARAFSSGAVATSGISSLSNSVRFFAAPTKHNAARTLMMMGSISGLFLIGTIYLVHATGAVIVQDPQHFLMINGALASEDFVQKPLLYQVTDAVFHGGAMPILLTLATIGILMVATATAFTGFPILASRIAEQRYLPMQLAARSSSRLYANSVLLLGLGALGLLAIFGADVNSLIQLYVVGVLTSMTLTQTAVIRHKARQLRLTLDRFKRRSLIRDYVVTALGLSATALSLLVVLLTKLGQGAWITVLLILTIVGLMIMTKTHYNRIDTELELDMSEEGLAHARRLPSRLVAVVYVPRVRKPVARALAYARASRPSRLEAVTINMTEDATRRVVTDWDKLQVPAPLTVLDSPYRDPVKPMLGFVRDLKNAAPRTAVVVYLPEYVVKHWWERIIHRRTVHKLAAHLRREPGVIVASVPWNLGREEDILAGVDTPRPIDEERREDQRG
ncbi:amino acid permease [Rothia sp. LK2588]|uniref:APC family permease n=1 Tax=Rothia sp. LK2588 TaxID=3114369 RepID=UPI0034CE2D04